jgi:hypothetical protein
MSRETHPNEGPEPMLRRMLMLDTIVGVLVNAGVFPLILWLVHIPPPAGLLGPDGGLADAVKATALPVVLMTPIMTLVLRARFRKTPARIGDLIASPPPPSGQSAGARLIVLQTLFQAAALRIPSLAPPRPNLDATRSDAEAETPALGPVAQRFELDRSRPPTGGGAGGVLMRTFLLTLVAVITLAPLRVGLCLALDLYPLSQSGFVLLNVAFGVIIGLVFMPPIFLAAMADTAPDDATSAG